MFENRFVKYFAMSVITRIFVVYLFFNKDEISFQETKGCLVESKYIVTFIYVRMEENNIKIATSPARQGGNCAVEMYIMKVSILHIHICLFD